MKYIFVAALLWVLAGCTDRARDQGVVERDGSARPTPAIYKLEELTWKQIDALDRSRTLFILPLGMIEQHGPHLPVGSDTFGVLYEADGVAKQLSRAVSNWNIVMMPPIHYGQSGANQLGDMPVHPGTYAIRQSTLRSLVADIGAQVSQNGFKWIFVLNGHGAPTHNIAINQACDFVSERFAVTMLHITGLFRADPQIQSRGARIDRTFYSAAQIEAFGMDVHAGVGETSGMLAIRPELVQPGYKTLPNRSGGSLLELRKIATTPGWTGYLSSPANATPEYGAAVEAWWTDGLTELILQALNGEDMLARPRVPAVVPPDVAPMLEVALANENAFGAELESWLMQHEDH